MDWIERSGQRLNDHYIQGSYRRAQRVTHTVVVECFVRLCGCWRSREMGWEGSWKLTKLKGGEREKGDHEGRR